jgi:hypothetical protein
MAPDPLFADDSTIPRPRELDLSSVTNTIVFDPTSNGYYHPGDTIFIDSVYGRMKARILEVERRIIAREHTGFSLQYDSNYYGCNSTSWSNSWFSDSSTGPGDTTEKIRWRKYWKEFLGYRYGHRGTDWAQPSRCSYHKARFSPQRLGHAVATRKRPLSPIQRHYRNAIKRASQPRQPHRML